VGRYQVDITFIDERMWAMPFENTSYEDLKQIADLLFKHSPDVLRIDLTDMGDGKVHLPCIWSRE
jgi:hypothetical protein